MKLPFDWICEFAEANIAPAEAAHLLTMAGLEVEAVEESELGAVLDIKVTPNRGDCLSVLGVARELAAVCRVPFKGRVPVEASDAEPPDAATFTGVTIESPDLCPRYAARIVEDLIVGPSPDWMQRRLLSAGMRPISNIVDITNYVMLETGQPLHAFDYDTLRERRIVVRIARKNEYLTTLDGVKRCLQPPMLVIADAERAVAIAGVMGGAETEIRPETRTLLLESAHFDWRSIRRTARALNLTTEASYRFERGVDPEGVVYAADRACQLIVQLGAGRPVMGVVDEYPRRRAPRQLTLRVSRCSVLAGYTIRADEATDALRSLGFHVQSDGKDRLHVVVPSWRPDILREEDLVEEVARVLGYDRIPERLMTGLTTPAGDSLAGRFRDYLRDVLAGAGLHEICSHSLVAPPDPRFDKLQGEPVVLRTAMSAELSCLRWSLIPCLCEAAARNVRRGIAPVAVFEVGAVFEKSPGAGPYREEDHVAALVYGSLTAKTWHRQPAGTPLFFVGRGIVDRLLDVLGMGAQFVPSDDPRLHPGRQASINVDGASLGVIGELHPEYAERYELRAPCVVFEIAVQPLRVKAEHRKVQASEWSRFPSVVRDLAPRVPEGVAYQRVQSEISRVAGDLLEELRLTDVYAGPPLPEGFRSFTFSLVFRAKDRTLTDAEVDGVMGRMRAVLHDTLGATFQEGL